MRDKRNKERYGIMCYGGRDRQRERDRERNRERGGGKVVPHSRWNENVVGGCDLYVKLETEQVGERERER